MNDSIGVNVQKTINHFGTRIKGLVGAAED
jgi:hypothetical protein